MSMLKFICGTPASSATMQICTMQCDFLLTYAPKYNVGRINNWFYLNALPRIMKRNVLSNLGRIYIVIPRPKTNSILVWPKSPFPEVEDADVFTRTIGYNEPFERIPSRFMTLICGEIAKKLFVLLTPEQRMDFIKALNVCVDSASFNKAKEDGLLLSGPIKQNFTWDKWDSIEETSKYLLSDINYKDLPLL